MVVCSVKSVCKDRIALNLCLATRRGARTVYMLDLQCCHDARDEVPGIFFVVFTVFV